MIKWKVENEGDLVNWCQPRTIHLPDNPWKQGNVCRVVAECCLHTLGSVSLGQVSFFFLIYFLGKCAINDYINSCSLSSKKKKSSIIGWYGHSVFCNQSCNSIVWLRIRLCTLFLLLTSASMVSLTGSFNLSHLILASIWNHEPCYWPPQLLLYFCSFFLFLKENKNT